MYKPEWQDSTHRALVTSDNIEGHIQAGMTFDEVEEFQKRYRKCEDETDDIFSFSFRMIDVFDMKGNCIEIVYTIIFYEPEGGYASTFEDACSMANTLILKAKQIRTERALRKAHTLTFSFKLRMALHSIKHFFLMTDKWSDDMKRNYIQYGD